MGLAAKSCIIGGIVEQASRNRAHLERLLLVCGNQNAGKSRLLRHMLGDERLGGHIPVKGPVALRALSRERCLAVLSSSPHEKGETEAQFHRRLDRVTAHSWKLFWRVNVACAVQPRAFGKMPDIIQVCDGLLRQFNPERIRVVQLAPDRLGTLDSQLTVTEVDGLRRLDVEVISIDARRSPPRPVELGNVRVLADFFDFS